MWFSFWRSRDRFSIDELRYLTEQLQKVQIVNEVNQDFVIEALRSIAELITYGDQHDSNFFEFFMEKQVMGELVRMLAISKTISVSLQLLQTMSIMIQNLKSEHAIYYMFSNEHVNYLITYTFDFRNEELLSYYISFLRAISGKLNKNTISLLVKTEHEEVVSFPLYVEAIRFAFHEENMVRSAVRVVTLNVYHVGDEYVNRFVTKVPHADYFSNLVTFFRKQCVDLNRFVYETLKSIRGVISAVDDIEDNLYYISDVISAGIPDVAKLITDKILRLLILPLLLPSLRFGVVNEKQIGAMTSLYLLCCILRIVKIKDLANIIAAALFCPSEAFIVGSEAKLNGYAYDHCSVLENQQLEIGKGDDCVRVAMLKLSDSSQVDTGGITESSSCCLPHHTLRHDLLLYLTSGNDLHVLGSLSLLATLLQTKELDETMLDALGILPQRKQHKKLLLRALVGEGLGEEQLFSAEESPVKDGFGNEIDDYLLKLKEHYGVDSYSTEVDSSPRVHRFQVLDALVSLFRRSNISAETFWVGGWLLRQLVPYNKEEFNYHHLELLRDSYKNCTTALIEEIRGSWPDLLIKVLCDEWKKCKRAIEAASPHKEPKCILLPLQGSPYDDVLPNESSFVAGEKMWELAKVFVLLHQLQIFSLGRAYLEQPPHPATDVPENSRAKTAGLDTSGPKSGTEVNLVDAVPCRIAFERGKERHFYFLAVSLGTSGWLLLAEELPLKQHRGVVRLTAPLAGSKPKIDDKHSKWLHLRIRPSTLPFVDSAKSIPSGRTKGKALVDGRWTLAFRDEEACKSALSMILVEINRQCSEVERRLKPLLDLEGAGDATSPFLHPSTPSSSNVTPSNLVHDLLLYLTSGNDLHVLGSLSLLATLLQTKELDETMLDALGILPQRKQHKKLLLRALVGEGLGEEQLFSAEESPVKDGFGNEIDDYLLKLKEHYGVDSYSTEVDSSPRVHRFQVLDALVSLFLRSNISAETFWVGGWLLRQLVPYNKEEFNYHHLELLRDSYKNCTTALIEEIRGSWPDLLIKVLCDEWKKCKRAIEAASPHKEPKCILLPLQGSPYDDVLPNESSFVAGEKMWELAKVFVLLHQLQIFSLGRAYLEQPPHPATDVPENSRAKTAGLDTSGPKSGTEVNLVDAVPCRIAFERGKERHFYFLAVSLGTSGWLLLAEELPLKQHRGVVRLTAPLAGSKPKIDDKHSKWLHLRIRPSTLPFVDSAKSIPSGRTKGKALVDGRWTLAFRDEEACKSALSMILVEINRQCSEVERRLKPLLDLEGAGDATSPFLHPSTPSSSNVTPSNLV